MRSKLLVIASFAAFAMSGAAYAADGQNMLADQANFASPIAYASSGHAVTCVSLIDQGMLTSIRQCHDQATWDRLRHEYTQKAIWKVQLRSDIQR